MEHCAIGWVPLWDPPAVPEWWERSRILRPCSQLATSQPPESKYNKYRPRGGLPASSHPIREYRSHRLRVGELYRTRVPGASWTNARRPDGLTECLLVAPNRFCGRKIWRG